MKKKQVKKVVYSSKEQANIALEQFKQLLNHPAWQRLVLFYQKKIAIYQDELLSSSITSIDELERLRTKIKLCNQMINLPEIMISDIKSDQDLEGLQNLDPFV